MHEALRLRVKDIDFVNKSIYIFRSKDGKYRYTLLPQSLVEPIKSQISMAKKCRGKDICEGFGTASLPPSLIRKYGNAAKQVSRQFLFPSSVRCTHPVDGYVCRHHIHFAILLQRDYYNQGRTSGQYRNYWDMLILERRKYILTW